MAAADAKGLKQMKLSFAPRVDGPIKKQKRKKTKRNFPGPPTEWHTPPPSNAIRDDTKVYKVKQPWATQLVKGLKKVENRTKNIPPGWIMVATSQSLPTKSMLDDCKRRLRSAYPGQADQIIALEFPPEPQSEHWCRGHIIGMIHVARCDTTSDSPWYNPGSCGWIIDDAWEFADPVPLNEADTSSGGFQTSVKLRSRPQYKKLVRAQLEALGKDSRPR